MCRQLAFHGCKDTVRDLALKASGKASGAARFFKAGNIPANICASPRFFAGEIERDLTLGASDHTQQLALRTPFIAAKALTLGDLSLFLFHF